jgi:hypothetical protein
VGRIAGSNGGNGHPPHTTARWVLFRLRVNGGHLNNLSTPLLHQPFLTNNHHPTADDERLVELEVSFCHVPVTALALGGRAAKNSPASILAVRSKS